MTRGTWVRTEPKAKKAPAVTTSVHQLKVTLLYVEPAIWRRLAVPSHFTLDRLHGVIQEAFGWTDSHMHAFAIVRKQYGRPDGDGEMEDESKVTIASVLSKKGAKAIYTYDFGDDWAHEIVVEQVGAPDPKAKYPTCTDGKRAAPPDDCGGPPGYERLLEALSDPKHDEHDEMMDSAGKGFDPEKFNIAGVNKALARIK